MADEHIEIKQKEKTAVSSASDTLRSRYGDPSESVQTAKLMSPDTAGDYEEAVHYKTVKG